MSSHRRKSLMPTGGEITTHQQNDDDEINDDEEEKRRRISERQDLTGHHHKNKNRLTIDGRKSLGGTLLHQTQPAVPPPPKPTNEQLSLLYNNCVKLLNENKINAKNAFQLKLIDYMSDIVLNKEISGGATNFQVVGCTIDVGTKIYAARVDALHQNTYQVLSGLGRGGNNEENTDSESQDGQSMPNDNEDGTGGDNDDEPQLVKKAKKKKSVKKSHLVENVETITSKLKDEYQDEDLYFSKVSTCIENEGIAGVLLNKIHVCDDFGMLLIDKDEQQDPEHQANRHEAESATGVFRSVADFYRSKGIHLSGARLCPDFNFKFTNWDANPNDDLSKIVQNRAEDEKDLEEHRFDANNVHSRLNLTVDNIANEIDVDLEMDGDHPMDISEHGRHDMTVGSLASVALNASHMSAVGGDRIDDIRSTLHSVADLTSLISSSSTMSEYSYFNFEQLKLHNLPKHLKQIASRLAANQRLMGAAAANNAAGGLANANGNEIDNRKAKQKQAPRLELRDTDDLTRFFKVTKKMTYLCDRTLEKRSEKPMFMESERQTTTFESKEFFQPFWKKIKAKILCDGQQVENLLMGEENEGGGVERMRGGIAARMGEQDDDDEPAIGGIDDDFIIPNTAETAPPFFSQNGGEYAGTNGELLGEGALPNTTLNTADMQPFFDGDNLIEAPIQINAINLEYAKTAKNIDVRRLKQIIWALLNEDVNGTPLEDKENISANESALNRTNGKEADSTLNVNKKRICASLKDIYLRLKPPLISQRVFDDLSVCIVFQMLLFLANEHNLILTNDPLGSNLMITSS